MSKNPQAAFIALLCVSTFTAVVLCIVLVLIFLTRIP